MLAALRVPDVDASRSRYGKGLTIWSERAHVRRRERGRLERNLVRCYNQIPKLHLTVSFGIHSSHGEVLVIHKAQISDPSGMIPRKQLLPPRRRFPYSSEAADCSGQQRSIGTKLDLVKRTHVLDQRAAQLSIGHVPKFDLTDPIIIWPSEPLGLSRCRCQRLSARIKGK